jgi:hypothetical protein
MPFEFVSGNKLKGFENESQKVLSPVCIFRGGETSWENEARETAMVLQEMPQEFSLAIAS